jgi:hypothetical protein
MSAMKRPLQLFGLLLLCTAAFAAKPVKIVRNSSALEFSYEWPAEAEAIKMLEARFRTEMRKAYLEALANGREDQKIYREQKRDGIADYYSMKWTSAGETARLLSLENELGTFTGGAHPNTSYGALLWDRGLNRETSMDSLVNGRGAFEASTRGGYCKALDRERLQRREGEKPDLDEFNACPKYSELAIAPVDRDRNGRFDRIDFVASPYTAGPYAEGEYRISLPVSARLVRALKPQFRASFEVHRQ